MLPMRAPVHACSRSARSPRGAAGNGEWCYLLGEVLLDMPRWFAECTSWAGSMRISRELDRSSGAQASGLRIRRARVGLRLILPAPQGCTLKLENR